MMPGQEANIDNSGKSIYLLHNNCMLSVLIGIASKKYEWKKKASLNICFLDPLDKFRMDSKNQFELAMVNEPSVFELLRFDCI